MFIYTYIYTHTHRVYTHLYIYIYIYIYTYIHTHTHTHTRYGRWLSVILHRAQLFENHYVVTQCSMDFWRPCFRIM